MTPLQRNQKKYENFTEVECNTSVVLSDLRLFGHAGTSYLQELGKFNTQYIDIVQTLSLYINTSQQYIYVNTRKKIPSFLESCPKVKGKHAHQSISFLLVLKNKTSLQYFCMLSKKYLTIFAFFIVRTETFQKLFCMWKKM